MPARLRLEVFDTAPEPAAAPAPVSGAEAVSDADERALGAFENGYKAGWDDAAAALDDAAAQARAEAARALQALAFTHADARAHVVAALEPLLRAMVARLLPAIARDALVPQIAAVLAGCAAGAAEAPLELVVAPAMRPAVAALLAERADPPVHLVEDPALGAGQAWLRQGAGETRIDLDAVAAQIAALIADFFDEQRRT
jgi:flagellar assembly protein FliH